MVYDIPTTPSVNSPGIQIALLMYTVFRCGKPDGIGPRKQRCAAKLDTFVTRR